jgi:predicted ATPase/class 3 adenylate cyclase
LRHFLPHFIQENYRHGLTQGTLRACTMFVDLSGFTRLTEKLMEKGPEGVEELSRTLNQIFEPTVSLVYAQGGFIPYYAGDSFTAIFPENLQIENATALVVAKTIETARLMLMRFVDEQAMEDLLIKNNIGIKIGLSVGNVEWGIVGNRRKSFYFRGKAIDACAQAQTYAKSQEVVCDQKFKAQINDNSVGFTSLDEPYFLLNLASVPSIVSRLPSTVSRPPSAVKLPEPDSQILADFLPKEVAEQGGLGEFRNVVSVFISFSGVERHEDLDKFASVILDQSLNFSGYFKEIDFGDKGGVMMCIFGAPISFENNIERALEFAAAIQDELKIVGNQTGALYKVGITSGNAYTGIIGSQERCQYAAVGTQVNLAARLMASGHWGDVIADDNVQRNRNFKFTYRGEIKYKGFESPIATYILTGRNLSGHAGYSGEYVGRKDELQKLITFAQPFKEGRFPGIAFVFGEAGIGKTRLSHEFHRLLRESMAVSWYNCQSDQILRKPFNPFIYFLKNYFEQSPENSEDKNREVFEENFLELMYDLSECKHEEAETLRREIARTQSVFGALMGIQYAGSLWEQLDARGRYQNAFAALTALFIAESLLQPVVIELEDAHWYDDMSREFLAQFVRRAPNYPIFMYVTSRYEDDGNKAFLIRKTLMTELDVWGLEVDLNFLQPSDLKLFAEARLGGTLHSDLLEILQKMTQGNPFYVEQMVDYFKEAGLLMEKDGTYELKNREVQLSDSVKQIMMARIDRLSGMVKETVKAAAVIGREFDLPILSAVMARQEEFIRKNGDLDNVLREQIQSAEKWQIWHAMNELRYIFKHSLLREAAYDMQLRTRLRELHQGIAESIEQLYPNTEERFVDLAFHFEQAEDKKKTNKYLEKAARYAQSNYQNRQALNFYQKIIANNLEKGKKKKKLIRLLLRKGSVHELIGQWEESEQDYREALIISRTANDWHLTGRCNRRIGQLLILRGNYPEAEKMLDIAINCFELTNDSIGISKAYGNLGTLFFRQGSYESARSWFSKAIEINRKNDREAENATIVANMGLIYMNLGNYDEGIRWLESQLDLSEQGEDKQGLNILYTNLGIIYLEKGALDSALVCLEKGLALSEELGNKLLMTICIGCIGSVYEKKGDYTKAMQLFDRDLSLVRELGDKQGTAIAYGLIGDLRSTIGEFDTAIDFLEKNLQLSRELNYKKGIAKALNTLGDTWFFKGNIEKASNYYSEAIEYARQMGNKLVLCNSLIEKGAVLLYTGDVGSARRYFGEGKDLAISLGNHDLQFSANILHAKIAMAEQNKDGAFKLLAQIISLSKSEREEAAAQYELRKIADDPTPHHERALELYRNLFQHTQQYLFRIRLEELETGVPENPPTPLH